MRASGSLRVGDADRDIALELLGRHYADGRLDHAEYDQRATAALRARTQADLATLFRDLPALDLSVSQLGSARRPVWFLPAVALVAFLLLLPITIYVLGHAVLIGAALLAFFVIARRAGGRSPRRRPVSQTIERAWLPRGYRGWPPHAGYGGRS